MKAVQRAWLFKQILGPSFFEDKCILSHLCHSQCRQEDRNFHLRFTYNICMLLDFSATLSASMIVVIIACDVTTTPSVQQRHSSIISVVGNNSIMSKSVDSLWNAAIECCYISSIITEGSQNHSGLEKHKRNGVQQRSKIDKAQWSDEFESVAIQL